MDSAPATNRAAKSRTPERRILFFTRQIAEATNTAAPKTHQLGGRHKYPPAKIPEQNKSAAQKSGCRADICVLLRETSLACLVWWARTGLRNKGIGAAAIFADAKIKRQFFSGPGERRFLNDKSAGRDRSSVLPGPDNPDRSTLASRGPAWMGRMTRT